MAYRVVCALLLLCPSISADSINKLFSVIVPSGRTAHSNRRSEGVNAVSKFIHRNYGRCGAVKILLPQWTTAPAYDFLLQVAAALNESPDSDAHTGSSFPAIKSVSFFHMRNTSSFVGGFLDGFVAWTTPCVVNIVPFAIDVPGQELGTGMEWSAIENAFDFLYKLSSRDHSSNLMLLAVTGGTGTLFGSGTEGTLLGSKPLFNRLSKKLRNYRFACVVADDSVAAVVRFEDIGNAASFKLQRIAQPFLAHKKTLSGRSFNVNAVSLLPVAEWTVNDADGTISHADGADFTALTALSRRHNFTFKLTMLPQGDWGTLKEDGTSYTGMIQEIVSGNADLAIGGVFQVYTRYLGVGYTLYGTGCVKLAVPAPVKRKIWTSILNAFPAQVWGLVFGLAVAFWFFRFAVNSLTQTTGSLSAAPKDGTYTWMHFLKHCLAHDMGCLENGYGREHVVTRVAILAWLFISFLISGVLFRGLLTRNLTAIQYEPVISNVEDVFRHRLPLQNNELISQMDLVHGYNFKSLVDLTLPKDFETGLDLLALKQNFGVFESELFLQFLQHTKFWDSAEGKPRFELLKKCFLPANAGWVGPKHAYWLEDIRRGLAALNAAGLIDKWYRDVADTWRHNQGQIISDGNACSNATNTGPSRFGAVFGSGKRNESGRNLVVLSLDHLGWLFVVLMVGMGISVLTFLAEIVVTGR